MDAILAKHLANHLLNVHGLTQKGWKFNFDSAKKRFGVCCHGPKTIGLSLPLTKLNTEEQVKDTILHEIAHALVGPQHGHDNVWKRKCIEIGAKPERCYSSSEVTQPKMKYVATCGACGKVYQKARMVSPHLKRACPCQGYLPWDKKVLLNYTTRY
jgi:predicted SprT family Zn-dependent metalloprotease